MTLFIDGQIGEGGGQVLRTSLSLAAITGKDFFIDSIRGKRKKPGLQRQHLACVKAAAAACGASCEGDTLHSQRLAFRPGKIKAGNYFFDIGSAGSCCLVLQTVLPILFHAGSSSSVVVCGGTHNPMAPTADFLIKSFLPAISRFGFHATLNLVRHGFYPAGGGRIVARVNPVKSLPRKLEIMERGNLVAKKGKILLSKLPKHIAERETKSLTRRGWFSPEEVETITVTDSQGAGNVVSVILDYEKITCLFQAIGEKGKKAEKVASEAHEAALFHHKTKTPVEKYLADQLLIYLALVSEGSVLTSNVSLHSETNMMIIEKFLPVTFRTARTSGGWHITCSRA